MSPSDHDLLIEMKTMLFALTDDFRTYRKDSRHDFEELHTKDAELEHVKLSRVEFEKHEQEDSEIHDALKREISYLQKALWMALGAVAIIQIIGIGYIIKIMSE